MNLAEYLTAYDETLESFARRVGRSKGTISRIARGINRPDPDTTQAIIDATSGRVTADSFYRIPDRIPMIES